MHYGLRSASAERPHHSLDTANNAAVSPDRLRIRYTSGRNARAAQLAAHYTRALAGGRLQIQVEHGASDLATDVNGAQPSLIVVIHLAGERAPLIADECGGRVDWRLEGDGLSTNARNLAAHLHEQVARLLCDLGYLAPESTAASGGNRGPHLLAA